MGAAFLVLIFRTASPGTKLEFKRLLIMLDGVIRSGLE